MKDVDGTGLINVPKIMGTAQPQSGERIEFDDLLIQQHLDVTGIAGRGQTRDLGRRGIASLALANIHPGADLQSQTFDPYAPTFATTAGVPWPPLDQMHLFDVYMLGPISALTSAADSVTAAVADIVHAVSLNNAASAAPQRVAFFDNDVGLGVTPILIGLTEIGTGRLQVDIAGAHRLVPGAGVRWTSESAIACTMTLNLTLLITAIGIPQDAR